MAIPTQAQVTTAINRNISPDVLVFGNYPDYLWCTYTKTATGSAKLEFHDGWVNWTNIRALTGGTGWLAAAHSWVRAEFPAMGIVYLTCYPGSSVSEAQLKAQAPWANQQNGSLRWTSVGGVFP